MSCERYLQRVAVCHTADLAAFEPWFVGGLAVGCVHRQRVAAVLAAPTPFGRAEGRLQLRGEGFAERTAALADLVDRLAAQGLLRPRLGELYAVPPAEAGAPLLAVDRTAVPWFGVRARGVHANGFVRQADGLHLWIARRARGKRTFPGHLDNMVAGGQAMGLSASATLEKECHEEAGVPAELARRAVPVGSIDYRHQDGLSLKVDTLVCYDLELPPDFTPRPVDGEVEAFERWSAAEVAASLRSDAPWKPNCALVALHFLLRHGCLDAELSPDERQHLWLALHGGAA